MVCNNISNIVQYEEDRKRILTDVSYSKIF